MAKITEEVADGGIPKRKISLSKHRFTLLISLLIAIIILLCIIILLLSTLGVFHKTKNRTSNNETIIQEPSTSSDNLDDLRSTADQPQIPGSSHKLIYRDRWGGRNPLYERPQKTPVKYVLISHTAGKECHFITDCSKQMVQIQRMHTSDLNSPDIGYNFLIGGDENIYVARGWDNHNFHMNRDTIGISFIGNYLYNKLNTGMIEATLQLLKMGVDKGKLEKDYIIVAHNQTFSTLSPGPNIYNEIKFWPHFSPDLLTDEEDK